MKSKLALILGIICIAVSAVTLFSALSHGDDSGASTLTFTSMDSNSSWITDISISKGDSRLLRLDVTPIRFPTVGQLSIVYIQFSDSYEASVARDILTKQKMDLVTSYIIASTGTTHRAISFVKADGQSVGNEAPQAALVYSSNVFTAESGKLPTLQSAISKQVRANQLNEGIYVGAYGKMMWTLDGYFCRGKVNENNSCHTHEPIVK